MSIHGLGYAIFSGQRALVAHLRDDNRMVPANAARCINCHGHMDNAASFAPPLHAGTCSAMQSVEAARRVTTP